MSEIKVNKISPKTNCGTVTVGDSGDSVSVSAGVPVTVNGDLKSNALKATDGGNIINQCGTTVTLGASGDTIALASGASQTGFGRTGTVDWVTTVQTGTVTAATGKGYFVNTTSGEITVNLPAGSAGSIVSVCDYAGTADTNAITISANGSEKIEGSTDDHKITAERGSVTMVYIDSTQGWLAVNDASVGGEPLVITYGVKYVVVAGGGGSRCASDTSGGGGAGGYRAAGCGPAPLQASNLQVQPGTSYPITVGGGGPKGSQGSSSIFSTITSAGGGPADSPQDGGSGGAPNGSGNTPPVSPPQGNDAGGGGGGGAGGAGQNNPGPSQGGAGGIGAPNCIASGTPFSRTVFAGGGGGGADPPGSSPQPNNPGGAPGGGGTGGARGNDSSTDGAANSGGGAGGQGANLAGQAGGSGVVVIRYTTADAPGSTSGGTKSTVGSCTVHVFTGPGTFSA